MSSVWCRKLPLLPDRAATLLKRRGGFVSAGKDLDQVVGGSGDVPQEQAPMDAANFVEAAPPAGAPNMAPPPGGYMPPGGDPNMAN